MREKTTIYLVIILLTLTFFGGFIYFKNKNLKSESSYQPKKTQSSFNNQQEKIREITVVAKQWAFEPSVIKVKQNEKVQLRIKSVDVVHGFALPDFNINIDLNPNQEKTIEFVADKKGKFNFFCSFFCGQGHQEMRGMLVVE